jgi:hypothetical protein
MTILMGFLGLAIDVGLLYRTRQNVQIAADAAATAAAMNYLYTQSALSAQSAGRAASAANGFTNGSNGVTVTVNLPPQSGPNQNAGFAEAIVQGPSFTTFMRVLGINSVPVSARSVAGAPTVGTACIWLMATSGTALYLQGAYDIDVPNCGIYVNSSSPTDVSVTGNGGTVTAKFLDAVGSHVPDHQTDPTPVTPDTAPRTSPWGNLDGPSVPSGCDITSSLTSVTTSNQAIVSGSSGNNVVCFTNAVTLNGVSLPGASSGVVYVFESGVTLSGTVTFGSGTYNSGTETFSNTSGAVMEIETGSLSQGNAVLNIYAPTAGSYNGVAVLQPATNTNQLQVQFGSSNETLDGYIYAPGAEVYLQDNGGGVTAAGIVANELYDKASSITIPSYDLANSTTSPNRVVSLVE